MKKNLLLAACLCCLCMTATQRARAQYVPTPENLEARKQFEGFRFGALMRESYRKGDPSILAQRVGKRDPSLIGILSDRRNWFIGWKGQIGKK